MYKYIVTALLGMALVFQLSAQKSFNIFNDETNLELKVKQIDEFMKRFNFEINYDGSIPASSATIDDRLGQMYTVFHLKEFMNDNQPDSVMTNLCKYVIDNNLKLRYEDDNWMAQVVCNAVMGKKSQNVSLFMQPEQIRDVLYKWVLIDMDADFMQPFNSSPRDSLFISPADHGISFITLPRIINLNVTDVNTVFKKGWTPDRLSVFNYLIASKKLRLTSVSKVVYHWNLGDYSFDVERFEGEDSPNQGWLISKITCNQ